MLKTLSPSVPAAFFGIVLGLVGLGSCWREASRIWNAPAVVGESVMAIAAKVLLPYSYPVAATMCIAGGAGQLAFAVYRTSQLWTGGRDPESTTPVLDLPTAGGNFVSAIVAATFDLPDLAPSRTEPLSAVGRNRTGIVLSGSLPPVHN